jgi:hypothetical protein
MSVSALVNQISIAQSEISVQSEDSRASGNEILFVIEHELYLEPSVLENEIRVAYEIDASVERIFPEDAEDPDLGRLYLLRIPGVAEHLLRDSPFDLAYDIQDRLGYQRVEPDLQSELFPTEPDPNELGIESGDFSLCFVKGKSPPDRAWAPRMLKVPEAWAFSDARSRPARGRGISIAQVDTGYTDHPAIAGSIDPSRGWDFIDGDADPRDPLVKVLPIDNPGHGTATASVVVGGAAIVSHQGQAEGGTSGSNGRLVAGTAPEARLVPIRAIRTVIRTSQINVARTINFARREGFPIITMSLGGFPSIALWSAVGAAVRDNIIVLAAAGNCVGLVVYPARYRACIAVAGINQAEQRWKGSSSGSSVDVSAPGELVWRASAARNTDGSPSFTTDGTGEGTSFAVAMTAGVAALWLAHHGRDALIRSLARGESLADRFRLLLKSSARVPNGWDAHNLGAGIVDADRLLRSSVSEIAMVPQAVAAGDHGSSYADLVDSLMADEAIGATLGAEAASTGLTRAEKEKYGLEIIVNVYRSRLAAGRGRDMALIAQSMETVPPILSEQVSAVLARPGAAPLRQLMEG